MYCRDVLRLSESEAYNRIEAARAVRRFPLLLDLLVEGALNLTTVRLRASHLTESNHQELLASAAGKSWREVEELLSRRQPRPDVAASVRKLPAPRVIPAVAMATDSGEAAVTPLRQAQDLLRHAVPTGDPAEIIDRALTLLIQDLARKKFAATDRPRASRGTAPGSRGLSARLRRAVWRRDDGRCAAVGTGGRRCDTRAFLEFHHVDPWGVGGEATVDNIELRCRAHNDYEADLFYGRRWQERRARSGRAVHHCRQRR